MSDKSIYDRNQNASETRKNNNINNSQPSVNLIPQAVSFEDGSEATFQVAEEFSIMVAAEGLEKRTIITAGCTT